MSPPERFPPDDPREWLNRARSNLAQARTGAPPTYFEDLCFSARQAAEKAIKAAMIARGIDFPYVHDLGKLMSLVESHGGRIPPRIRRGADLTRYAVHTRYPSSEEPVSEPEHAIAVATAEAVVRWAEEQL